MNVEVEEQPCPSSDELDSDQRGPGVRGPPQTIDDARKGIRS